MIGELKLNTCMKMSYIENQKFSHSEVSETLLQLKTFFIADLAELLEAYKKKDVVIKEFEAAKLKLKKAKSLLQMAELNKMKRVLRRMNYCDQVT